MNEELNSKFVKMLLGMVDFAVVKDEFNVKQFDAEGCLAIAARAEQTAIVRELLSVGCDVNARTIESAINAAVNEGNVELVELLLKHGADPNLPNERLLFGAIRNVKGNGLTICKILVEHGIDINRTFETWDKILKTALDWSVSQPDIHAYLNSLGAKSAEEIVGKQSPPAQEEDEVGELMADCFGPIDPNAFVELVSKEPPIAVRIIRPNRDAECLTLFTSGMSVAAMSVSEKDKDYAYAELFIQLPADWPTTSDSLSDPNYRWPIAWLKRIARYPHLNETSLKGPATVITNADSNGALSPNNGFTAMLVISEFDVDREDGAVVHLYRLTPLYPEEVQLQAEKGMKALLDAFDAKGISRIVDVDRPNSALDFAN